MARLVLLIVLGLVAAFYFPDSRAWLLDAAEPGLDPLFRWQTTREAGEIVRGVRTYEREHHGTLPDRREWPEWLERNYLGDAGRDSWGNAYFFETRRDSFFVVSAGPDLVIRTADDVRVGDRMSRPDRN